LDNNPKAEYLALFERPRIIYPDIAKEARFAFTESIGVLDCTLFFAPSDDQSLCAILNSSACEFFFRQITPQVQNGYLRYKKIFVSQIPIPPATPADKARLSQLAEACAAAAQRGDEATLAAHEAEIDQIVYRLFDLTPEEIALIESALAPTRSSTPKHKRGSRTSD